jgi:chemotaxis protein methyltransferase CheR
VPLPPDIVAGLARRLADHAGLELPVWVIESRATARIEALGVEPRAYLELVRAGHGASELVELIEAVRVGETRLFRHRPQVAALGDVVVPALRARGRRAIRVWSVGCAAGEEPYTLAIVLAGLMPGHALTILATDVSADALEVARRATYPATAIADVPPEWRDGFVIEGDIARVRPEIAATVTFERKNLADADQPRGFDLVWCRNVLIYFTPPARKRAIERLVAALEPGGFLFVGYSESLRDVPELDAIRTETAVCYVRKGEGEVRDPLTPSAASGARGAHRREVDRAPAGAPRASKTPAPAITRPTPVPVLVPVPDQVLSVRGTCDPAALTAELTARLAAPGLRRLAVDLDAADLIPDEVAPVLRRARAAATTAGVTLVVRATRPGPSRWLRRHNLDEGTP